MTWMLAPLAMCLVIAGIHAYLGLHVLERKVIFVDLGLAQIAALGATFAFVLGYDPEHAGDSTRIYFFSLGFTVIGAAVFSVARMRAERVPQEAFIGIVYATASAVAVLLAARAPGEAEHVKQMLVGNILLVTWREVATTAALYAVVGAVHIALRRPFWEISRDAAGAAARGRRVRAWDFVFYLTFGVVITRAVAVAGVLLVFTYLVVPATCAAMLADRLRTRMALAWAAGVVASAAGIGLSYLRDLPTGPSVVACFAGMLLLVTLLRHVARAARPGMAALRVAGAGAVAALLLLGTSFQGRPEAPHQHQEEFATLAEALRSANDDVVIEAIHHLEKRPDPHSADLLLARLAAPSSERVIEHLADGLAKLGDPRAVAGLSTLLARDLDPFLRLDLAAALLSLRSPSGFRAIRVALESDDATVLTDRQAAALLAHFRGDDLGLATATPQNRPQVLARLRAWLDERGEKLRWREERRRFE